MKQLIEMKKFGPILNGRPLGREAAFRVFQIANPDITDNKIELDFTGIKILTPSFADEFLQRLEERFGTDRIQKVGTESPAVQETLKAIAQ